MPIELEQCLIPIEALSAYLPYAGACEKAWAQKITVAARKQLFLSMWGYVRFTLANVLGVNPVDLMFARTKAGKPYIANKAWRYLQFNISHTKQYLALCYNADNHVCGIDIEAPRPMSDLMSIAKRFYAPTEYLFLQSLNNAEQQLVYFFKLWVIKEAVLKACGQGLSFGIEKVCIDAIDSATTGEVVLTVNGLQQRYHWQFSQHRQYFKAVALVILE